MPCPLTGRHVTIKCPAVSVSWTCLDLFMSWVSKHWDGSHLIMAQPCPKAGLPQPCPSLLTLPRLMSSCLESCIVILRSEAGPVTCTCRCSPHRLCAGLLFCSIHAELKVPDASGRRCWLYAALLQLFLDSDYHTWWSFFGVSGALTKCRQKQHWVLL